MDSEIKTQWVAALRSGEYRQGRYSLMSAKDADGDDHPDPSYCCLGVLCDLAARADVVEKRKNLYGWDFNGESGTLPAVVQEWAGLSAAVPTVPRETEDTTGGMYRDDEVAREYKNVGLAELNDDRGRDFNYIADMIERHL